MTTTTHPELTAQQIRHIIDTAGKVGATYGKSEATWVEVSEANATDLLDQIEGCEFEIPFPLSGEWADGLTIERVMSEVLEDANLHVFRSIDEAEWLQDEVLNAFEFAYSEAYEAEVTRACEYYLG